MSVKIVLHPSCEVCRPAIERALMLLRAGHYVLLVAEGREVDGKADFDHLEIEDGGNEDG